MQARIFRRPSLRELASMAIEGTPTTPTPAASPSFIANNHEEDKEETLQRERAQESLRRSIRRKSVDLSVRIMEIERVRALIKLRLYCVCFLGGLLIRFFLLLLSQWSLFYSIVDLLIYSTTC